MPPKKPEQATKPKESKVPAKGEVKKPAKAQEKAKAVAKVSKEKAAKPAKSAKGKAAKGKKAQPEKPVKEVSVWEKKPRNFGIGNDIRPKMDLTRFTKWPKYVVLQRKKRVLQMRLKVPPSINQFTKTLNQNNAANLFKLLNKYRPEERAAKRARLHKLAEERLKRKEEQKKAEKKGKTPKSERQPFEKPIYVKCGINHVTRLIEHKKAALVVIAHDVDPIEMVLYLPALCRKQGIPFCFVKGKARLGQVVHKKTATALVLTGVRAEDRQQFSQIVSLCRENYNDKYEELKKKWGGGIMGLKSQAVMERREKIKAKEESDKAKYK